MELSIRREDRGGFKRLNMTVSVKARERRSKMVSSQKGSSMRAGRKEGWREEDIR